jgi:hypothetical protein
MVQISHKFTSLAAEGVDASKVRTSNWNDDHNFVNLAEAKAALFTAVSYGKYVCNTSGGAFTVTLPATPAVGDFIEFYDYNGTWATNNLTLARSALLIDGAASDLICDINNVHVVLTYVSVAYGWQVVLNTGTLNGMPGAQGNQGNQGTTGGVGTQGNQGTPGATGAQADFYVQGTQLTLAATTFSNITGCQSGLLPASSTWAIEGAVGTQAAAGTQGQQFAIQCSVAGAVLNASYNGVQTSTTTKIVSITAQGAQGAQVGANTGITYTYFAGHIALPATTAWVGLQCKGLQATTAQYVKVGSWLKLTRLT